MIDSDKKKFAELLTIAAEATGFQISDTTYKTYWAILKNLSISDFEQAINSHLLDPNDGMFFPKPANIIKQITGTEKQQAQSLQSKAEMAWQVVEGEIRRTGSWGSPRIDDGLALAAVKSLGGWSYICSLTMDKMTWLRKEFISSYQNYSTTPVELLPQSLPGRAQIENARKSGNGQGLKTLKQLVGKTQDENNK